MDYETFKSLPEDIRNAIMSYVSGDVFKALRTSEDQEIESEDDFFDETA